MSRIGLVIGMLAGIALMLGVWGGALEASGPGADPANLVLQAAATGTPSLTPSPGTGRLITLTPTPPPPSPTETLPATATPAYAEHVIQPGESCLGIATRYGHVDPAVITAIEQLNNVRCQFIQEGSTLKIPFPTPTPTAIGADLTQTAVATSAPPNVTLDAVVNISVQDYIAESGDTLSSVALKNDSTMRQICELNPLPDGLNCSGCTWESPHCCCPNPPLIREGQRINVPAPSPTPTASPTFTGNETPTPTPTYRAPQPVTPVDGATVTGPVTLTWLTVGVLNAGEAYYVVLRDEMTGATIETSTRQLSFAVPADMLLNDGQAHRFAWSVQVVRTTDGGAMLPISPVVVERVFTWAGWE